MGSLIRLKLIAGPRIESNRDRIVTDFQPNIVSLSKESMLVPGLKNLWFTPLLSTPWKAFLYTSAIQGVHFSFCKCCTALCGPNWSPRPQAPSAEPRGGGGMGEEAVLSLCRSQCTSEVHLWDLSSPGCHGSRACSSLDRQEVEARSQQQEWQEQQQQLQGKTVGQWSGRNIFVLP